MKNLMATRIDIYGHTWIQEIFYLEQKFLQLIVNKFRGTKLALTPHRKIIITTRIVNCKHTRIQETFYLEQFFLQLVVNKLIQRYKICVDTTQIKSYGHPATREEP